MKKSFFDQIRDLLLKDSFYTYTESAFLLNLSYYRFTKILKETNIPIEKFHGKNVVHSKQIRIIFNEHIFDQVTQSLDQCHFFQLDEHHRQIQEARIIKLYSQMYPSMPYKWVAVSVFNIILSNTPVKFYPPREEDSF